MIASQNVTLRRECSTSVHMSPDVGHGIGGELLNAHRECLKIPKNSPTNELVVSKATDC